MAWRPGPRSSLGLDSSDYDERDPWIQRFISKTDDGELSLDVNAMNGLETAAGAVFVELIRQQAERPVSPADSTISSWMPGHDMGRQGQRHPPAMRMDPPMAQYEPFRRTYVSDPSCVPQLRFANVPDAGADHDKREASRHWRRSGRTWSRVPRFRKGETAFTHDPNYKPPHAVVDKWYMTEAGPKVSLVGRVEESRWQSCHSMQSGREPRKPTRSRLPQDQQEKPRPGPASYHMRDPWEVREVCGAIPKSRVFCKPVRRVRPQTSAFTVAPGGSCDMSVDTSAAPPPSAATAAGDDDNSAFRLDEPQARPATAGVVAAMASSAPASTGAARDLPLRSRRVSRTQQHNASVGGGVGRPSPKPSPGRHQSGNNSLLPPAAAAVRAARARPAAAVGPSSFARAERPHVADEGRRKEESYGKKVVRLLTGDGDVLVTVTRRRASVWGDVDPPPDGAGVPSKSGAVEAGPRAATTSGRERQAGGDGNGGRGRGGAGAAGRGRNAPGGWKMSDAGSGRGALPSTSTGRKRYPTAAGVYPPANRAKSLEARAKTLLPGDLTASLPVYREPGKSELPVIFRATSAPIVRAVPGLRVAERVGWRRAAARANQRGAISSPDGNESPNVVSPEDGRWRQELCEELEATHMARVVRAAENIVAKSSGRSCGGGGGGVDVEPLKSGVRTRIPAPSGQDSGQHLAGGDDSEALMPTGLNDGSCDFVSSTIWSGGETAEVSAPAEAR
ncbi:unnamed protein product [Ectocarpus fasciculatus]